MSRRPACGGATSWRSASRRARRRSRTTGRARAALAAEWGQAPAASSRFPGGFPDGFGLLFARQRRIEALPAARLVGALRAEQHAIGADDEALRVVRGIP